MIAVGQTPHGAYSAAPTFGPYRDYCWFRDGSFIADAMSRAGETSSAERFFDWGAEIALAAMVIIGQRRDPASRAIQA